MLDTQHDPPPDDPGGSAPNADVGWAAAADRFLSALRRLPEVSGRSLVNWDWGDAVVFVFDPAVEPLLRAAVWSILSRDHSGNRPDPHWVLADTRATLAGQFVEGVRYEHNNGRAFRSWVFERARNAARLALRDERRGKLPVQRPELLSELPDSSAVDDRTELWGAVAAAIARLPLLEREAVSRLLTGERIEDLARRLGTSCSGVTRACARGLIAVRNDLQSRGITLWDIG